MRVHLGGHLAFYGAGRKSWVELTLAEPQVLDQVIARLGIPRAEIAIAAVNGEAVDPDTAVVLDADELQLYPPMDGG